MNLQQSCVCIKRTVVLFAGSLVVEFFFLLEFFCCCMRISRVDLNV